MKSLVNIVRLSVSHVISLVVLVCGLSVSTTIAADLGFLAENDPQLTMPAPVKQSDSRHAGLWLQALNRPEFDMQRMAAETIARAHEYGVPELATAIPRLEDVLQAESSPPAVRFAAARALIALDSRDSGDALFDVSQRYDADLRQLVEPALAEWGHSPAVSVWTQRLAAPDTRLRDLIQAIRGLGRSSEHAALPALLDIVSNTDQIAAMRLEAAAAAGRIATQGLEQMAAQLSQSAKPSPLLSQLCAVRLLVQHSSSEAVSLLVELAGRPEPAVAAAAMERLNAVDSKAMQPLIEAAFSNPAVDVRKQAVVAALQLPALERIAGLSQLLNDPHRELRETVRDGLVVLTDRPELNVPVRESAMRILEGDDWRGQQQASLLLGTVDHKPAARRLIQLLSSPRVRVRLLAAWALRRIAVPETVPALIREAGRDQEWRVAAGGGSPERDAQIAYLLEALGVLRAEEAVPLLVTYVPKNINMNTRSRCAAIWALGMINEGRTNPEIEQQLTNRVFDESPQPLEKIEVKRSAAIALGRMQAADVATDLRFLAESLDNEELTAGTIAVPGSLKSMNFRLALGWTVEKLSGEPMSAPQPLTLNMGNWFLEPVQ